MGFATRQPTPNDPSRTTWAYGPQEPHDDFSALLNDLGATCASCKRVTMNRFLTAGTCPECCASPEAAAVK